MRCGVATFGADAGFFVAAAGRRRDEGPCYTGERHTLRYGVCGAGEMSGTAGGDQGPAAQSKFVASLQMVRSWSWSRVAKGAAGDRLARTSIKLWAARWASLAEDIWSMANCGEKSTVLVIHLSDVDSM